MANHIPSNCYPVVELNDPTETVLINQFIDLNLLDEKTAEQDYIEAANAWIDSNPIITNISAFDDNGDFITPTPPNCVLVQYLPRSPVLDLNGDVLPLPEGYIQIIENGIFLPLQYDPIEPIISPAPEGYTLNIEAQRYEKRTFLPLEYAEDGTTISPPPEGYMLNIQAQRYEKLEFLALEYEQVEPIILPAPEGYTLNLAAACYQKLIWLPVEYEEDGVTIVTPPEGYTLNMEEARYEKLVILPLEYEQVEPVISPAPNGYILNIEEQRYDKIAYQAIPSPENTYYVQTTSPDISQYPLQPATQAQIDAYNAQEDARIAQEILQNGREARVAELNAFSKQLLNNGVILNIMPFNESVSTHTIRIPSTMAILTDNLNIAHGLKSKAFSFPSLNRKVYFEEIPQSCIETLIDDIAYSKISIKRRILLAADKIQAAQTIEEINAITLNLDNLVPTDTNFGIVDNVINYNMTEDIVENIIISKIENGVEIPLPIVNADGTPNSQNIETLTSLLAYA